MGYSNAYPNTSIESFRTFLNNSLSYNDHPFTESSFNWIWSTILNVYFAGFAVGSWISVPLADKIGRKWGLVIGNSLNFLSAVIATLSIVFSLPWLFLVNRIIFAISAAISMNSLILLLQCFLFSNLSFHNYCGQEAHILLLAIEREKTKDDGSFYDLFHSPHLRKGLLLGVITLQVTTSIWPVLYFSTEFLNRANISYENAEVISTTMLFLRCNMLALLLFVICSQVQPYYDPIKYGCIVAVIFHGISYSRFRLLRS
uniref:MFS domain-containing protein n=1 Tax=Heterorhabditis bacteriophora TaxID=37862 RepID=A0A1I7WTU3_HETBA